MHTTDAYWASYSMPTQSQWEAVNLEAQGKALSKLLAWAEEKDIPNNSQIREMLGTMICNLAKSKVEQAEMEWQLTVERSTVARKAHFNRGQAHEKIQKAVQELAQIEAPIEEPPRPAPGYHDSNALPELDEQRVPIAAVGGDGGDGGDGSEGAGSAGSAGVPAADPTSAGATQEEELPDWDDEREPFPIDPLCDDLKTPADFGLGESFRKYTGWTQEELELQLVPLLRVQLGENELVERLANELRCPAQMLEDAILLRRQHENLARRRSYAMSEYGDEEVVKANAKEIMKKHEKDFAKSEAQRVQREFQKMLGPNYYPHPNSIWVWV